MFCAMLLHKFLINYQLFPPIVNSGFIFENLGRERTCFEKGLILDAVCLVLTILNDFISAYCIDEFRHVSRSTIFL